MELVHLFLFIVLLVCFVVNGAYMLLFARFAFHKSKESNIVEKRPVSIIVYAQNASADLQSNIHSLLTQDYPEYEVIVVDDCSYDDTEATLTALKEQYTHLRIVQVNDNSRYKGKKFALVMGIKAAKYNILLFTEAECRAQSNQWISNMQKHYTEGIEIVLGYSSYLKGKGLLNRFIRFDVFMTALNYLSFVLKGSPYTGSGRNLSYKKELFFKHKGFARHMHLSVGEDDLFVYETATKYNTRIEYDSESHTHSLFKGSFSEYIKQKQKQLSVGRYHKFHHRILLSLRIVTLPLFLVSSIILMILKIQAIPVLSLLILYLILQMIVYKVAMKKLSIGSLWIASFFLDLFYQVFMMMALLTKPKLSKLNKWK